MADLRSASNKAGRRPMGGVLLVLAILAFGVLYVGKTWSPSSYGYVLMHHLGYAESGPDWGVPRPIRSDEWAVVTPLTQATINNNFERFNRTSLYGEDLRINYGLPLHDWGLAFKPTMWLFGLVNPAYAYSFHWFALTVLFLVGYAWMFRWLGATPVVGAALAASLYYTGFVQFWWNEKGSEFALFPWVILPFATRLPLGWKAAWFYWAAVAWLLTNFYPPIQISLAFVGLALLLAKEPLLFKPRVAVVLIVAAALAAATAAFYLIDYLQATAATIYPGSRSVSGGSLTWQHLRSWLWPAINFGFKYESPNICEIGTLGLYYTIIALFFIDFAAWRILWEDREKRRQFVILGGGLALMFAWLVLPLPPWVGAPLLWNHVQPERMQYAAGLLLVFLTFTLVQTLGLRVSFVRLTLLAVALLAGWWIWKFEPGRKRYEDLVILVFLVPAALWARQRPGAAHAGIAIASLLAGALLFGRFNPLQPAWPIFNLQPNATSHAFNRLATGNEGVLAITGLPGAVGNGLGYRSLSHLTAVPQMQFWHERFPDIPAAKFNLIFNRYSHIIPDGEAEPHLLSLDSVGVPVGQFQKLAAVRYVPPPTERFPLDGNIDVIAVESGQLLIKGWGPWRGPLEAHELEVSLLPEATGSPRRALVMRPDLPAGTGQRVASVNGFTLIIPMRSGTSPRNLCVFSFDASTGTRTLLRNPPGTKYCGDVEEPPVADSAS